MAIEGDNLFSAYICRFSYIYESAYLDRGYYYIYIFFFSETVRNTICSTNDIWLYAIECTYETLLFFWIGSTDCRAAICTSSSIKIDIKRLYLIQTTFLDQESVRSYIKKDIYRSDEIRRIRKTREIAMILVKIIVIEKYRSIEIIPLCGTHSIIEKCPESYDEKYNDTNYSCYQPIEKFFSFEILWCPNSSKKGNNPNNRCYEKHHPETPAYERIEQSCYIFWTDREGIREKKSLTRVEYNISKETPKKYHCNKKN